MPQTISEVQRLYLELMKLGSFNNFNGPQVVDSLLKHQLLWEAAVMTDERNSELTIRDIDDEWHVCTLFLKVQPKYITEIERLAKEWNADEFGVLSESKRGFMVDTIGPDKDLEIVRLWWD